MRDKKVTFIVQAAVIAALYVVLTFVANALGLASHTIQVRFSEALCILPVFTPAAIPGLWIGCLLANLLTGAVIYDVIFGSIATLLAAVCTYLLRNHKIACTFPPVIFNMIIVPFVLVYAYGIPAVYFHRVVRILFASSVQIESLEINRKQSAGQPFPVKVVEKDETTITFDANHEMAGKELNFTIELVSVEE